MNIKTIGMFCDSYVDQGRYIGETPVGYKCFLESTKELPHGQLVCEKCSELLETNPTRILFVQPWGKEHQARQMHSLLHTK